MQKRVSSIVVALIAGLLAATPCARAQKVFGIVEMDSWNAFSANLAAFCQSSGLPFALTGLNGMTGPALKAPNLTGVDVRRPIRLYLLLTTKNERPVPAVVIGLPLDGDGTAYLDVLRDAFETAAQNGEAHVFTGPKGLVPARKVAVVVTNGVALVGDSAADAGAVAAALRTNGVPAFEMVPADIRVGIDMQALLPFLEQVAEQARRGFAHLPPPPTAPGMSNMAAVVGAEVDAALAVCRQIRRISIGFKADADAGTLLACVDTKPNTTLNAFLRQMRPPSERYTTLLPPETLFGTVGGGMAGINVLAKPYGELIAKVYQGLPGMAGMADTMRDLMAKFMGLYTGDYAVGLLPDVRSNGVLFAQILAVSDPEKARVTMRDGMTMAGEAYKSMPYGLSITSLPARVYDGVEVSSFQYRFAPPASNAPMNAAARPMAFLAPFLAKVTMEYAVVGQDMVFVMGRAGAVDQVIARVRKGDSPQFYRNARALFGDSATLPAEVGHLGITAAIRPIMQLLPGVTAEQLAALPPPGEGLGTVVFRRNDTWLWTLRMPTSEMRALVLTVPALQKSLPMGFMPGAGGAGTDTGAPPPGRGRRGPRPAPTPVPPGP